MKMILRILLIAMCVALAVFFGTRTEAAPELQNRDSAFSLLITAFGEVQSSLIESDYEDRLQAAQSIHDNLTRQHIQELAGQERDLRLKKLDRQIAELSVAYVRSRERGPDEEAAGPVSPVNIDTAVAHEQLKRFVIIGAGEIEPGSETNQDRLQGSALTPR